MDFHFEPEEFIVEEIAGDGTVLETDHNIEALAGTPTAAEGEKNEFSWFILQKRNWNTQQALEAIAEKLHVPKKRFNFAGTKDRNAITTQLCSVFGVSAERMLTAHVKDVKINGAWPACEKITFGMLKGNRFRIIANKQNCDIVPDFEKIKSRAEKTSEIINYFGRQRFGSLRSNTHLVGRYILKADYKAAVENYLSYSGDQADSDESISDARREELAARKRVSQDWDFKAALGYFPHWLKYEVSILRHLSEKPTDYIGALRKMPRSIQLMFIHAAQADVFNSALKARVAAGKLKTATEGDFFAPFGSLGFPDDERAIAVSKENKEEIAKRIEAKEGVLCASLVGYDTVVVDEFSQAEMEKLGITGDVFSLKSMPELSSRGGMRPLWVNAVGLKVEKTETEKTDSVVSLSFSLPSGAYATVAVEQLIGN